MGKLTLISCCYPTDCAHNIVSLIIAFHKWWTQVGKMRPLMSCGSIAPIIPSHNLKHSTTGMWSPPNRQTSNRKKSKIQLIPAAIYSVGSNGDFTFELGMQREVGENICEYHIFDMGDYESKIPPELKRVHYHRWGLWGRVARHRPRHSLRLRIITVIRGWRIDTIQALGHDKLDGIDIFVSGINQPYGRICSSSQAHLKHFFVIVCIRKLTVSTVNGRRTKIG
jgi:hypothetical protein